MGLFHMLHALCRVALLHRGLGHVESRRRLLLHAPNTHVQMEEMDHGSLGANALIADGSLTTIKGSLGLGVKLVPSLPNSEQVQLSLSGRTGAQGLSGSNHP